MPDPLGDDAPTLFPGADKVVHAIMFGFLDAAAGLSEEAWLERDRIRGNAYRSLHFIRIRDTDRIYSAMDGNGQRV